MDTVVFQINTRMLTLWLLLSLVLINIGKGEPIKLDNEMFQIIYESNPGATLVTNQFNEEVPCVKIEESNDIQTGVYCKYPNDDSRYPRLCNEVVSTIDSTATEIICPGSALEPQPLPAPLLTHLPASKPDNNRGDEISTELCSVLTTKTDTIEQTIATISRKIDDLLNKEQKIETIDQKIDVLLNKITNLHISASHTDERTDETDEKTITPAPTTPAPISFMKSAMFWAVYDHQPPNRKTNQQGESCILVRVGHSDEKHMRPFTIYCISDRESSLFAYSCIMDENEQIVCPSKDLIQQRGPDPAAVQLRNIDDNMNDYKSTNESDRFGESIKISLVSMWLVLALIVIVNAIFIWCYMKRNKGTQQTTHAVIDECE